ncbi:hypothetical protein HPB48_012304 [Haemaphysalis longicornis]|uniref:Cytochrome P450 n=1 Tax=Haemaphysalis longicornis TaxID=44386 RepID=A0A9J6FU70_HAELO|nr:hypothetical protein HPB48_012304 [Haemaphysalis longicornis]
MCRVQFFFFFADCFPELHHIWFLLTWLTSRLVVPYFMLTTKLILPVITARKARQLGVFTQKNVMEMPYLDMVLNETMRYYTGVVGFNAENKHRIHPASFQPFGKGPRECLGRNFALLEMKLMLSKFLANFKVSVDEEHHKEPIKLKSSFIATIVPNGVWMKLEKVHP